MKILNATEILDASDLATIDVAVPEWGPDAGVRLRSLTGAQFVDFVANNKETSSSEQAIRLVAMSVVNADGEPAFTPEQVALLGSKSFKVIQRLQDAALKLNGLGKDDKPQEAAKND